VGATDQLSSESSDQPEVEHKMSDHDDVVMTAKIADELLELAYSYSCGWPRGIHDDRWAKYDYWQNCTLIGIIMSLRGNCDVEEDPCINLWRKFAPEKYWDEEETICYPPLGYLPEKVRMLLRPRPRFTDAGEWIDYDGAVKAPAHFSEMPD